MGTSLNLLWNMARHSRRARHNLKGKWDSIDESTVYVDGLVNSVKEEDGDSIEPDNLDKLKFRAMCATKHICQVFGLGDHYEDAVVCAKVLAELIKLVEHGGESFWPECARLKSVMHKYYAQRLGVASGAGAVVPPTNKATQRGGKRGKAKSKTASGGSASADATRKSDAIRVKEIVAEYRAKGYKVTEHPDIGAYSVEPNDGQEPFLFVDPTRK